jgi:hypothetical protein
MPPRATWLNRDKPRPFTLADGVPKYATLIYGSTQLTEKHAGAACIEVPPRSSGVSRNGLWMVTHFYPGILALMDGSALPPPSGFLGKSLDALRDAMHAALGIGQSSCHSPGAPAGSRRGRIVVLNADVSRHLNTTLAVVLTEHSYSAGRRYQVILPIVPAPDLPEKEHNLVVRSRSWLAAFRKPVHSVVLPIPTIFSIWHSKGIARETEHVVDDGTLAEIDRALCGFFSLPEPQGG